MKLFTIDASAAIDPLIAELAFTSGRDAQELFPETRKRLRMFGLQLEGSWREKAAALPGSDGRPLALAPYIGLNHRSYEDSVTLNEGSTTARTVYDATIGSSDKQAILIEDGSPGGTPLDLHVVLPTARKARRSKQGHLYLRIPLRHAESSLSSGVVKAMKAKPKYLTLAQTGVRPSATDTQMFIRKYAYSSAKASQLTRRELHRISQRARTAKMSDTQIHQLTGLMRVGNTAVNTHNAYLTIRTLSERNPEGWRIKPYPAQKLGEKVYTEAQQAIDEGFLTEALRADGLHIASLAGIQL